MTRRERILSVAIGSGIIWLLVLAYALGTDKGF